MSKSLSETLNFPPLLAIPRYFIYLALAGWLAVSFGLFYSLVPDRTSKIRTA